MARAVSCRALRPRGAPTRRLSRVVSCDAAPPSRRALLSSVAVALAPLVGGGSALAAVAPLDTVNAPLVSYSALLETLKSGDVVEAYFPDTSSVVWRTTGEHGFPLAPQPPSPLSRLLRRVRASPPPAAIIAEPTSLASASPPPPQPLSSVFRAALPPGSGAALLTLLSGVQVTAAAGDGGLGDDLGFAARLSAFAAVAYVVLTADGGLSALLKRPAREFESNQGAPFGGAAGGKTTLADVAGCDEAKAELAEVVDFLKNPGNPPGTGKTMLAKAVAGEAGVSFFAASSSEFVELFVGLGGRRVRSLFAEARKKAPCVVFLDEIDAVGKARQGGGSGAAAAGVANEEREQTLNQLLAEMDGFETGGSKPVVVLAATNRPETLDAALRRPGRFDRTICVSAPDRRGREAVLRSHLARLPSVDASSLDPAAASRATVGLTGAALAAIVNEAAVGAAREGAPAVAQRHLDAAIARATAGAERPSLRLSPDDRRRVAVHESGHALAAALLERSTGAPLSSLSIVPRLSGALGVTVSPMTEDALLLPEAGLRARLVVLLAGRAAEAGAALGRSSGASDDLRRATALAHDAVTSFGMSSTVGPRSVGGASGHADDRAPSALLCARADDAVDSLLRAADAWASAAVGANTRLLENLVACLEEEETLAGPRLRALVAHAVAPPGLEEWLHEDSSGCATQGLIAGMVAANNGAKAPAGA